MAHGKCSINGTRHDDGLLCLLTMISHLSRWLSLRLEKRRFSITEVGVWAQKGMQLLLRNFNTVRRGSFTLRGAANHLVRGPPPDTPQYHSLSRKDPQNRTDLPHWMVEKQIPKADSQRISGCELGAPKAPRFQLHSTSDTLLCFYLTPL